MISTEGEDKLIRIALGMLQLTGLCLFTYGMNGLSEWLGLNIPGSILGLVILFLLLKFNIIKLKWVEVGGNWLVAELLLFFIPAAVGVLQYKDLILGSGYKILIILLTSSSIVMICSGLLAEKLATRKEKTEKNEDAVFLKSNN